MRAYPLLVGFLASGILAGPEPDPRPRRRRQKPPVEEKFVRNVKFLLQTESEVGLKWDLEDWMLKFDIKIVPATPGYNQSTIDDNTNSVKFSGLNHATNYWISVAAKYKTGRRPKDVAWTKETSIRVFTAPKAPFDVKMVDFDEEQTTLTWKNPNEHADSAFPIARLNLAPEKIAEQVIENNGTNLVIKNMPAGTSYDLTIFYVFNQRRSDSYVYRVTRQPKPVKNLAVDKIKIQDKEKASLEVSWEWPSSYWGSVKVTVSPPIEGQQNEWWITDRKIPVRL